MLVKVRTNYTTCFECEVEAASEEEARQKAAQVFWDTPDEQLHKTFFRNRKAVSEECEIVKF